MNSGSNQRFHPAPYLVVLWQCWLQRWTQKLWKQSPTHCPLSSFWTGQCLVSVRHSSPAFEKVVNQRQSYSGPGPLVLEQSHHYHHRSLTFNSFLSFSETLWGIVQPYWCFDEPWRRQFHCLRPSSPSNGLMALSHISSYFLSSLSQCQGLELAFDSHTSPFDIWAKMVDTSRSFLFSQSHRPMYKMGVI